MALTVGKKIKGRKRHIVVDTMGNVLSVYVHAANVHDTKAGTEPADRAYERYRTIRMYCGDEGYRGTFMKHVAINIEDACVTISKRIKPAFHVLPKRWVVERTFAWLGNSRRLSKDFEYDPGSSENMLRISHMSTLLRRVI